MGASRGIGRGIAEALAREGARVALASRSLDALEEAAAQIRRRRVSPCRPTRRPRTTGGAAWRSRRAPGSAGGRSWSPTPASPIGRALDNTPQDWEARTAPWCSRPGRSSTPCSEACASAGSGASSTSPRPRSAKPIPGLNLSNTYRMAAAGFFKTLAREVAADGITVNTIATGRFATDRLASNGAPGRRWRRAPPGCPRGTPGDPAEFGDLVTFLSSERAGYNHGHGHPDRRRCCSARTRSPRAPGDRGVRRPRAQVPPASIIPTLRSCAWVESEGDVGVAADELTRNRSSPARNR